MNESNEVPEQHIIDTTNNKNIFSEAEYVIPLYQRSFAWKEQQLEQLIEDIRDISEPTSKYYIGSLVVFELSDKSSKYEVIDGQQRLTSLFLLLNCLKYLGRLKDQKICQNLTFACRERANITLSKISDILNKKTYDLDNIDKNIEEGVVVLKEQLEKLIKEDKIDSFIKNLCKVVIYLIKVPMHTDLNRYFEIMNTRGEQLEQPDVLKARLMGYLKVDENASDDEKTAAQNDMKFFAEIWDACSDMSGYIQMHFNPERRIQIFGENWRNFPECDWSKYQLSETKQIDSKLSKEYQNPTIEWIIKNDVVSQNADDFDEQNIRVRFESIISFPYFLLHILKVYIKLHKIKHKEKDKKIVDELLDDKKLLDAFDRVINNGVTETDKNQIDTRCFSKNFIMLLLENRFMFDRYFIKREFSDNNQEGEWSLKDLYVSDAKPYYKRTIFNPRNNEDKTLNTINLMLQSALRVSYTSPKIMHWITELLLWLNLKNNISQIETFSDYTEKFIKLAVSKNFIEKGEYSLGVDTPHIAFNYLDYLIWKSKDEYLIDNQNFKFEFRNSVEHWYPQHPSENSFSKWEKRDELDSFGNLCLVQRNINSKFSNLSPEAKKLTYEKMISKGSLKLRIMAKLTEKNANQNGSASEQWKDSVCQEHQEKMLKILRDACRMTE